MYFADQNEWTEPTFEYWLTGKEAYASMAYYEYIHVMVQDRGIQCDLDAPGPPPPPIPGNTRAKSSLAGYQTVLEHEQALQKFPSNTSISRAPPVEI